MSKSRFDSSQMLPLFHIIAPSVATNSMESMPTEVSQKHRKRSKRPEVSVHKSHTSETGFTDNIPIHKTFSANYNSHKNKHKSDKNRQDYSPDNRIEENSEVQKTKVSRKQVLKENDRILTENQKLSEQLSSVQHTLNKKESQVLKLKEKVSSIQIFNKEVLNENNIIKTQYQDLLVNIEELKTQMKTKITCKSCEELKVMLAKSIGDLNVAKNSNKDLNDDLNMLKNVIYRLNVQLERYQDKLRKSNVDLNASNNTINAISSQITDEIEIEISPQNDEINKNSSENIIQHSDHLHSPISWGNVNSHTLGPLLDAYQDTINEKENIIKSYELEFSNFTGKLKSVLEENQILHKKSIDDSEILKKNIAELETNRSELKTTKEQNDLLIKKCALKHDKLLEICKVYDQKIDTIRRDYDVLLEQYNKARIELCNLQSKYSALVENYETLKNDKQSFIPLAVHTNSVNECKRLFEELKINYEHEKTKLMNQIKLLEEQTANLGSQVVNLGTEKKDLQIKVKSLEKQLKKVEHKFTETQNNLTHTQISRDTCKRQLEKAIDFGRELVNEQESLLRQLSTRQKENKAVKQMGSNIANRMDVLKSQLKCVQKDAFQQLASVEQRIQEQDSSMESLRKDHEIEIEKLLKEIKEKDDFIEKLVQQNNALPSAPYLLYRDKHVHLT